VCIEWDKEVALINLKEVEKVEVRPIQGVHQANIVLIVERNFLKA
jgi:hypothetical protein